MRGWLRWTMLCAGVFMLIAVGMAGYVYYVAHRAYPALDEARLPQQQELFPYTRFLDHRGEVVDLQAARGQHQVLLVFMRGFDGYVCWYCTRQTADLVTHLKDFEQLNTKVYLVYPGPAAAIPKFLAAVNHRLKTPKAVELPIPVLMDVDLKATNALGIPGDLAQPTSFILDPAGKLAYRRMSVNMQDRPTAAELLKVLATVPSTPLPPAAAP